MTAPPTSSVRGVNGAVSAAEQLATNAGAATLQAGGNAVDAAIATNAVMAVVAPHQCGMGGDLFALVHKDGTTMALNASGRAGSGADPDALRGEGHTEMPLHHDIRTVTVPGCVDGWIALHERFGTMPLGRPAGAGDSPCRVGFPASPLLAGSLRRLDERVARLSWRASPPARTSAPGGAVRASPLPCVRLPTAGAAAFYEGAFGAGLIGLGNGLYSRDDLARTQADWVEPLSTTRVRRRPLRRSRPTRRATSRWPRSRLAEQVGLPDDPDDPAWAHLLDRVARPPPASTGPPSSTTAPTATALLDAIDCARPR